MTSHGPQMVSSHNILLEVKAIDNSSPAGGGGTGNVSPVTSLSFTIDNTPPVGTLAWPLANQAVSSNTVLLTGSETDVTGDPAGSGVTTLQVEISTGTSPKYYWTGSSYTLTQTWITTATANPWTYNLPSAALASGTLYYVRVSN